MVDDMKVLPESLHGRSFNFLFGLVQSFAQPLDFGTFVADIILGERFSPVGCQERARSLPSSFDARQHGM